MVENIADEIGIRILRNLQNSYNDSRIKFGSDVVKNEYFRDQIIFELNKSAFILKQLMTLAPANSDGLSGKDLSIMSNDLIVLASNVLLIDVNCVETFIKLADKNTAVSFLELLGMASKV
jgi:hypothetical protein